MTENEAIKMFNDLLDVPCEMLIKYDSVINSEKKQALVRLRTAEEMAINALEKQMQKKVKYEDVGYDQYNNINVYACICPSCGLEIIRFNDNDISDKCESGDTEEMFHSSMVHHAYIGLNNYCNRCGQKLNWESDEE